MPELPEVETVRRALEPVMVGAHFDRVSCNRPNLRFAFPEGFVSRLTNARVEALTRRGKYMLAALSSDETLIMHLGMSGRFNVMRQGKEVPGKFHHEQCIKPIHDHVEFQMGISGRKASKVQIVYNDPRRFGFMDLVKSGELETCRHFVKMGPEPLGNGFSEAVLKEAFAGRAVPVKQALLDQQNVAGLGNIYVCEALFRAGISPKRKAGNISGARISLLVCEIRNVLEEAIEAGGSSLKDFVSSDGSPGYFQHNFCIYGRENEACRKCERAIHRIIQGGRSTFYCPQCQR